MSFLKNLFERFNSNDRRKAGRLQYPDMAAYYWTGGAPKDHGVRDISAKGLFLVTDERWYPGTLVMMTLQKTDEAPDSTKRSISVQTKIVRWDADGVGLEFLLPEQRGEGRKGNAADRKTLEKFLEGFSTENGHAFINSVVPPSATSLERKSNG